MGQDNEVPRRINRAEGAAGQLMVSRGPGVTEVWSSVINLLELITADHTYAGFTCLGTAGEALVFGDLVYRAADGEWYKADANAEASTKPMLAMVCETIGDGSTGILLLIGFMRDDDFSLTDGAPVWVSHTAVGGITSTPPVSGDFARKIGDGCDTSEHIFWFCPDHTVIEVA